MLNAELPVAIVKEIPQQPHMPCTGEYTRKHIKLLPLPMPESTSMSGRILTGELAKGKVTGLMIKSSKERY